MKATISDHQVIKIREEADARILNVREWANWLEVSPETVRRIARRDTHRHVGKVGFEGADRRFTERPGVEEFPENEVQASLSRLLEELKKPAGDDKPMGNAFE